ncbi:zinc dependent phospholipase C family protein [Sphingobacterium sp. Mn56C]
MKKGVCMLLLLAVPYMVKAWGFYAHKLIHEKAIFLLPKDMAGFYKNHRKIIIEKAVAADQRVFVNPDEPHRHYIDLDRYPPPDSIPRYWDAAVAKFTAPYLIQRGTVPWQIYKTFRNLIFAFKSKDVGLIIRYSADLGHYTADAHVPLHSCSNYNGQFTGQLGIHALWESNIPEMFAKDYNFAIGKAEYLPYPQRKAWAIVQESHQLVATTLSTEKSLGAANKKLTIKAFTERKNQLIFTYSDSYIQQYHKALHGMVEQRMRASIHAVASFWYTAWIEAGQPDISAL